MIATDVLIMDGANLAHRARHAYHLSYAGQDVSVTYGVMRMLVALLKKFNPASVIFAWDGGTPAFRKKLVPEYKATRKSKEEDPTWPAFLLQLRELEYILPFTGVLQVMRRGMEADDLMAHAAAMVVGKSIIITTDGDLLQCVSETTDVYSPIKDVMYTVSNFEDLVGYPIKQHVRAKTLQGDSSDNVRGVRGVGPKTVLKILGGVKIPGATQGRLDAFMTAGNYNNAYNAMDLSVDRAGARYVLSKSVWRRYNKKVYEWCIEKGFTSLIEAGSLGMLFGKLKRPVFNGVVVTPRIWDFKRYLVEGDS